MTTNQYWQERKERISLMYSCYPLLEGKGLIGEKQELFLLQRYGVDRVCKLENSQLKDLKEFLINNVCLDPNFEMVNIEILELEGDD